MEPLSLQRDVLYDSVWKRPISHLAKEWNVSPSKIVDACMTMQVPRPPTNHWSLVELGTASRAEPLPPANDAPTVLEIARTRPRPRAHQAPPVTDAVPVQPIGPNTS